MKIVVKKLHETSNDNDIPKSSEERFDFVEQIRLQYWKTKKIIIFSRFIILKEGRTLE